MKLIYAFICFLLLAGSTASFAATLPKNVIYASATVLSTDGHSIGICGGVFRTTDTVITAYHCIAKMTSTNVYDAGGNEFSAKPLFSSPTRDLTLLQLEHPSTVAVRVELADAFNLGDEIWLVGAPDGEAMVLRHGYIAKITNDNYQNCSKQDVTGSAVQQQLFLDARVYEGDSGGGVFNTDGQLLGIDQRMAAEGGSSCNDILPASAGGLTVLWGFAAGPAAIQNFLDEAHLTW